MCLPFTECGDSVSIVHREWGQCLPFTECPDSVSTVHGEYADSVSTIHGVCGQCVCRSRSVRTVCLPSKESVRNKWCLPFYYHSWAPQYPRCSVLPFLPGASWDHSPHTSAVRSGIQRQRFQNKLKNRKTTNKLHASTL